MEKNVRNDDQWPADDDGNVERTKQELADMGVGAVNR